MSADVAPEIQNDAFQAISELCIKGLTTRYQLAWKEVFRFIGAVFLAVRQNADPLFMDTIKIIEARSRTGGEGKTEAEAVIGAAITGVGPAAVLKIIPLNLEQPGFGASMEYTDGRPGNPGRAWLLPILKMSITNTELSHFTEYFVPLSERVYQKVIDAESRNVKTMELKILETVVDQIWVLLPSYCDLPTDLASVHNTSKVLANDRHSLSLSQSYLRMCCINKSIFDRRCVTL
jgi:ribosomal RNA-processing protein 12